MRSEDINEYQGIHTKNQFEMDALSILSICSSSDGFGLVDSSGDCKGRAHLKGTGSGCDVEFSTAKNN